MLFCAGTKIEQIGKVAIKSGTVIFSNHQSYFDILVLYSIFENPISFVAKRELAWIFPLGAWIALSGGIFISRKANKKEAERINTVVNAIKRGRNIVIFPEGTRSDDGKVGRFRKGAFKIPVMADAFSIAVCINGTYIINKKGSLCIKSGKVKVFVSEYILPDDNIAGKVRGFIERKLSGFALNNNLGRLEYASKG